MAKLSENIITKLTKHQFSLIKLEALIDNLNQLVPQTFKLLQINVDRYRRVPLVKSALPNNHKPNQEWQIICEIFPTFLFMISSQLKSNSVLAEIGHQLMIAGIGSMATQYSFQKSHTTLFLKQIDLNIDVTDTSKNQSKESQQYLPKLVHGDLHLIENGVGWPASSKSHDIIEHHYCLLGLSQIFLRYFFDLLCASESDEQAKHINQVFCNFFMGFCAREIKYWKSYKNVGKLKNQLASIIEKDSQVTRHPFLRKSFFDQLHAINPIIHNGGARGLTMSMKNVLQGQLETFQSLSITKMFLFLDLLASTKEANYAQYIIVQTTQLNPNKLHQLQDYILSSENKSPALLKIIKTLIKKIPVAKTIFHNEKNIRLKQAQKNLREHSNIAAYTSDQMGQYFKNYLNKLYDRVHKEGALTQDGIKEYLSRFKIDMVEIARKAEITPKEKEVFEESIDKTLDALTREKLTEIEMDEYKEDIHQEMTDFESVTVEERVEKVEQIEQVINAAVDLSKIKGDAEDEEKLYNEALKVELKIDDDPNHIITIKNFLEQPIKQKEKKQFLLSYTPNPLSLEAQKVIESVQFRCGKSSSNPVPIFNGSTLLKKALTRLLFPNHPFKELLQSKIIPILPEKSSPKISVRDFFTFPFAEKKKGPKEDQWFKQHIFYLEIAVEQGEIDDVVRQTLLENIDSFPIMEYKKYFNIVRKKKFEDTTFMAVHSLWQNNGLDKFRIPSDS